MKGKLIKVDNGWVLMVDNVMYATDNDKLSLKNCQAIERGYDLMKLAEENSNKYYDIKTTDWHCNYNGFFSGFQKAIELLGDKKFSEEDLRTAYFNGEKDSYVKGGQTKKMEDEYIQSLQQTEWDVEIEMKKVTLPFGANQFINEHKPLLDADGCLILMRVN